MAQNVIGDIRNRITNAEEGAQAAMNSVVIHNEHITIKHNGLVMKHEQLKIKFYRLLSEVQRRVAGLEHDVDRVDRPVSAMAIEVDIGEGQSMRLDELGARFGRLITKVSAKVTAQKWIVVLLGERNGTMD